MIRIGFLFLLLVSSALSAKTFFYELAGEVPSYIWGTVDVADERLLDIPPAIVYAFDGADCVCMPVHMDALSEFSLLPQLLLPGEEVIGDYLSPDFLARLDAQMKRYDGNAGVEDYRKHRIWFLSSVLSDLSDQKSEVLIQNHFVYSMAGQAGKETDGLATYRDLTDIFNALSEQEQLVMLESTLASAESAEEYSSEELIRWYLEGGPFSFREVMVPALPKLEQVERYRQGKHWRRRTVMQVAAPTPEYLLSEKLYRALYQLPNEAMAAKIAQRLAQHPQKSYFFVLHAGHLSGEHSLITHLQDEGFVVEAMPWYDYEP